MTEYHQKFDTKSKKWVKIHTQSGLIVAVKEKGKFKNISEIPENFIKTKIAFWDFF